MAKTPPPRPLDELTDVQARRMLAQMGENGKPPELGISHVTVGTDSYLKIIDATYVQDLLRVAEGSSFKLVQGTYGAGKTHFLYCVRDLAWRRKLLTASITISPKECPFNRPHAMYRAVAHRIELPRSTTNGDEVRGIDDVIRRCLDDRVAADGKDATRAWVDTLARAPFERHSFRDATVGFMRAVLDGNDVEARKLAAWLRGEEVPAQETRASGLYEVASNENGFGMMRSLVQLVPRLGFEGCVLLLDEAERRMAGDTKPTKAMAETVDHLRELIDLCGRSELPRTLILYAVTPAFTRDILPLYPALQQRLGAPVQFLGAQNPKAPVIDLEALDLEPRKFLAELGRRLVRVARHAYGWAPDDEILDRCLEVLVAAVSDTQLEVAHRRLFVKLWIRLLDQQRLGKAKRLSVEDAQAMIQDEQALVVEAVDGDQIDTFLGIPYVKSKPGKRPRG